MENFHQKRSVESAVASAGLKYSGKFLKSNWPIIRIFGNLLLVRIGIKKTISFKFPYMAFTTTWASKLGLRSDTISYPGGVLMHRAIGVPEYDNSDAVGIMTFKKRGR